MSLSDRRQFLVLLGAAPLAACGFAPVYGPGGGGTALRGRIAFEDPDDALAFGFVSRLEERIGRPSVAAYQLAYSIRTVESALAVTEAEDINRINISGTASYSVTETATGNQVQAGEVATFSAFASSGSPVATMAARRDAEERLMIALADQVVSRLLAGASTWP